MDSILTWSLIKNFSFNMGQYGKSSEELTGPQTILSFWNANHANERTILIMELASMDNFFFFFLKAHSVV